jgi:hypothetical protein
LASVKALISSFENSPSPIINVSVVPAPLELGAFAAGALVASAGAIVGISAGLPSPQAANSAALAPRNA